MNAEHYAQLIQFTWEYLGAKSFSLNGDLEAVTREISTLRLKGSGIYTLWIKTSYESNAYVPTYVGYTSRPIRTRLDEHARIGKIRELYVGFPDGAATTGGFGLMALELPTPMARAMESVFLETFDFAQNATDNLLSRSLVRWQNNADLSDNAPMPQDASDIEAFNDTLTAISDQLDALQELKARLMQLKG